MRTTVVAFVIVSLGLIVEAHAATISLSFNGPMPGTIQDGNGLGTGFLTRLPGTGFSLPSNDPNLSLSTIAGSLLIQSTNGGVNQFPGPIGNNLGNLETPGFFVPGIGTRDFTISAIVRNVDVRTGGDFISLYAGVDENHLAFAGINDPAVFAIIQNQGSGDTQLYNSGPGIPLIAPGHDLRLTFTRTSGLWQLSWQDLSQPGSGSSPFVAIPWLNAFSDLYLGIHVATPSPVLPTFTTQLDEFSITIQDATVVPEPMSLAVWGALGLMMVGGRFKKWMQ